MKKNLPIYRILDALKIEYDFNQIDLGKIFLGSVLEISRNYFISKMPYLNPQAKTHIKRKFISSLKNSLQEDEVHKQYRGMSRENFIALYQYRNIREDKNSIEGIISSILARTDSLPETSIFEGFFTSLYKGSKAYASLDSVKKRGGSGAFKNREYDQILEKLKEYFSA